MIHKLQLIDPHQVQFFNSNARYLLNSGGVGGGKTYSICLKAIKLIAEYPGIFGMIGAITYPLLRDTTLREFLALCPEGLIKSYNKTNNHFIFKNGSELIFRSFDDPNKLKSLNLGFCGIEEMTDVPEEIFKMIRTRMRQKGMPGCIFGATNPGTFGNWVYKYFIEKPLNNSDVVYSISADNLFLPEEYLNDLETMKESNPEYYERMVMGRWGSLEGVIYNLPVEQRKIEIKRTKLKRHIAGLDFGFTHPTAMCIIGIDPDDNYYIVDEVYRHKLTSSDIIEIVKKKMAQYNIETVYCDGARPEIIEDLVRAAIPAMAGIKDVFDGIMHVKSLIGLKRLFVDENCRYTLREFDSYIWDAKNLVKEVPIKVNDDCFTGNHKVRTFRGDIRLDKLKKTDLIYTRQGFKKILKIHSNVKEIWNVDINNHRFNVTEEHPFYSNTRKDFFNVFGLTNKDTLYTIEEKEYLKCQKQKLLYLMELSLDGGHFQNIGLIESTIPAIATISRKAFDIYIEKYGKPFTGKYLQVITFIIKMAIRLIMGLKILNVSIRLHICQNILRNGIEKIKKRAAIILIMSGIKLLNGIDQKRAGNGIAYMLKKFLTTLIMSKKNVLFAKQFIQLFKQKKIHLNFVQIDVSQNIDEITDLMTLKSNVNSAEKSFIVTSMQKKYVVQNPVDVNYIGKEKKEVYNLTVADCHEYFVDGVLVHNCMDAIRYALFTEHKKYGGHSDDFADFDGREEYEF